MTEKELWEKIPDHFRCTPIQKCCYYCVHNDRTSKPSSSINCTLYEFYMEDLANERLCGDFKPMFEGGAPG